jgi:Fur family ferric uptake transcriptional regulator
MGAEGLVAGRALAEGLRRVGLRVTGPRVAVMGVLSEHPGHHSVQVVAALARRRLGSVSTQAVYDVLAALEAAGLVRRIELPGHPAHFEARVGDNHHHLVCRSCGRTVDVDCVAGMAPCMEPVDDGGFVVEQAEVTFWGMCPQCQTDTGRTRSDA